jgi:hypothetical protein
MYRYHEYVLDYEAACASVALAHEVAKTEAARVAAEQLREAEVCMVTLPGVILLSSNPDRHDRNEHVFRVSPFSGRD